MYIKQLKLQNVGRFDQLVNFEFTRGFNVLRGENEAGKSTVVKAIETSFFGFKPMKDWKYANWKNTEATIECTILRKEQEIEITRKYGSKIRGTTRSGHVAESIGNQPIEGHLIDLELYKSLFSISVDELSGIDKKSWKELSASLTDAYNHSAFKSAAEAQEAVDTKASEIYRENGRGQYALKNLQSEHEKLKDQQKQLEIERAYAIRSEDEKKGIKEELKTLNEKIEGLDEQIRHYENNHQSIRRRREYRIKLDGLKQIEALDLPEASVVSRWIRDMDREQSLLTELNRINEEIIRLEGRIEDMQNFYDEHRSKWPVAKSILGGLLLFAGIGYGVFSFPEGFYGTEQAITGLLLALGVGVLLNVGLVTNKNRKNDLRAYDLKMSEISQAIAYAQMQRHHFEDEHDQMLLFREPMEALLSRTGIDNPAEMLQWINKASLYATELSNLLEQEEDQEQFLLSVAAISEANAPEEMGLNTLLNEREACLQKKLAHEQLMSHETNMSVKEIDYKLAEIAAKLGESSNQMIESAFVRDRLMLVSKIVAEAEKLYRKSQKPDFLIRASRYMSLLTDNKYDEILMTESGGFVLKSGSDLIPMGETISRGTKEQMYLALKLAMTFRLDPLGEYPILMDEIAVNFDKHRRHGLYKVLKELSEQRQIIYLSCHAWFIEEVSQIVPINTIELCTVVEGVR